MGVDVGRTEERVVDVTHRDEGFNEEGVYRYT